MKKDYKKTDAGVKCFEVTLSEMINKLNGLGICDSCSTPMKKGYLVPVLNYVQCEKCFSESGIQDTCYKEDEVYEERQTIAFKEILERD